MLKGKQKNIDVAAPFGKITGSDFKKLGNEIKSVKNIISEIQENLNKGTNYKTFKKIVDKYVTKENEVILIYLLYIFGNY